MKILENKKNNISVRKGTIGNFYVAVFQFIHGIIKIIKD